MRTTVTIDDELLAEVKAEAARQRRTLSDVVQDALRTSLHHPESTAPPVALPTFGDRTQRPLVDLLDREALAEALGDNEPPWHAT